MKRTYAEGKGVRPALILAAVLVVALAVRVIFFVELQRSELGNVLSLDSRLYRDLAHGIISGGRLPEGPLTFNPLYLVFLVAVFKLFGEGLLAPRILQLLIGLLTVVLIYLAGRRLGMERGLDGSRGPAAGRNPRAGRRLNESPSGGRLSGETAAVIASAAAVFYSQFVLYEGLLLSTTLEVFFFTASFVLALVLDEHLRGDRLISVGSRHVPSWLLGLLLGALCGAGALGRPNLFLLLAAALPVWLFMRSRWIRRGLIFAASFVGGAALFIVPPIVYNAKSAGMFVPMTAHSGINFYIGNRAGSIGIYQPPDDVWGDVQEGLKDVKAKAESETGHTMTQAEVSDYYIRRTLEDIRRDPSAWLLLMGRKLLLFFNGLEFYDMPNIFFYEKSCGVLKLLFVPFSVIAPLGICGLIVLFQSGRNRSVVSLFLGAAIVSVILFFVDARYRLPAVPIMILLAALFVAWAAREIAHRRLKLVAIMAAAALALFFLVSHRTMITMSYGAAYAFLGQHYMENKNETKAAEAFTEAYRLDPNRVEAMMNYARTLRRQRRDQEAAQIFARAYARMPRFPRLAIEYGTLLDSLGRREEAKKLYLEATSSSRAEDRILACRILSYVAFIDGKKDEAVLWVKRALEIAPGDPKLAETLKILESSP